MAIAIVESKIQTPRHDAPKPMETQIAKFPLIRPSNPTVKNEKLTFLPGCDVTVQLCEPTIRQSDVIVLSGRNYVPTNPNLDT